MVKCETIIHIYLASSLVNNKANIYLKKMVIDHNLFLDGRLTV